MAPLARAFLDSLADRPHESTHRAMLIRMRYSGCPSTDDGERETFTFSDGSRVTYDHTANPGHRWSLTDGQ